MSNLALPFSTFKHNSWVNSFTAKQLKILAPKYVLDIGCGDGFYGKLVKYLLPYATVIGVDGNPKWVEVCSALNCYHEVLEGDVVKLAPDFSGELVIAGDILEHLEEADMRDVLSLLVANFKWIIVNSPLDFQPQEHEDSWEIHRCGLNFNTFNTFDIQDYNSDGVMFNILIKGDR